MDDETASEINLAIQKTCCDMFSSTDVDLYFQPSAALDLLTIGELVDRLTIVNIKLFKLKDYQLGANLLNIDLALSAKADVNLVKERANLKKTITEKICDMIAREYNKIDRPDADEVKMYG